MEKCTPVIGGPGAVKLWLTVVLRMFYGDFRGSGTSALHTWTPSHKQVHPPCAGFVWPNLLGHASLSLCQFICNPQNGTVQTFEMLEPKVSLYQLL